jgi:DMSO/TMAO reductase YedYZ molybdopterin-dependent catalytic subunit
MIAGLAGLTLNLRRLPGLNAVASAFSVNGFEIYETSGIPSLRARDYQLRVDGLVEHRTTYTLNDILAMPRTRIVRDYHCVTGWTVANVAWTGVRMSALLANVRPRPQAQYVLLTSADGSYTESLDMQQAHLPDVLLGYNLDDKPLSAEQGFPLRLVIPAMYGFKYIKWVNRITLSADLAPGYWENRGYAIDAWLGARSNYGHATGPTGQR